MVRSSSSESEEGSLSENSSSPKNSRESKSRSRSRSRSRTKSRSRSSSRSSRRSRSNSGRESRGRPIHKEPASESLCLSRYYREHFGNHSPEQYLNLRVSGFRSSLTKEQIIDILEDDLKKMAPFEIKIVGSPDGNDRLAYLNFRDENCAKSVRRTMIQRLQRSLGSGIMLDPAGVLRDQEGKYIPDRFNRAQMGTNDNRSDSRRRYSPERRHTQNNNNYNNGNNQSGGKKLKQDDHQASRTLFVGNLPGDIRQSELMKTFGQYGEVEGVDIKIVNDGIAAYAFVVFVSVESAMKALKNHHDKGVRSQSRRCQIGYGSSQVSTRLWIGGLGEWTTKEMLLKEFDRFGEIEHLDYSNGSNFAYIHFAEVNSATDACSAMKGYSLHKEHRILVDYAKEKKIERKRKSSSPSDRKRPRSRSSSPKDSSKRRKPRTPSPAPSNGDSKNGQIKTYEELNEQFASTWKGLVVLKKTEYPLKLHRVSGREHLLQDLLREESGSAIKIKLDQRIERNLEFYDRIFETNSNQLAFMIGAEGSHSFTPLIEYLNDKKAIGMTQIGENGSLFMIPNCSLAAKILKKVEPKIRLMESSDKNNFLLVILKVSSEH